MSQKLSIDPQVEVSCPRCHESFVLQAALTEQLIDSYRADYDTLLDDERKRLQQEAESVVQQRLVAEHKQQMTDLAAQVSERDSEIKSTRKQLQTATIKAAELAREEAAVEAAALKQQLVAKDQRLEVLRANEVELRKQQVVLEEQSRELNLEVQRQVDEQRKLIEASISERHGLQLAELQKQIEDAKKANQVLERKLSQGSQQLQGEVLELELEEVLGQAFPLDAMEPVRKGKRGADLIQVVKLASGTVCGRIVWESKRAENWSNAWVGKLKDDQNEVGGEIGVLVSTAFPTGVDLPMMNFEDVWLVRPQLIKPLADALRMALIEAHKQRMAAAGKDQKVEALYQYVTSPQFAQKVRAVVDAYRQMRRDLDSEKAAMQRLWKKRETQLERITSNVMGLVGELEGTSQEGLPQLDAIAGLGLDDG